MPVKATTLPKQCSGKPKKEQSRGITFSPVHPSLLYSKNVNGSKSVASQKTLAKSVFSMATSKITSDGLEEEETDEDEGFDYNGSATKTSGVENE